MEEIIQANDIEKSIITLRDKKVLLDSDISGLYGVPTREINRAVKNNLQKFPKGYTFELSKKEFEGLRWKFSTAKLSKIRIIPKAFTEKGLYMLVTCFC